MKNPGTRLLILGSIVFGAALTASVCSSKPAPERDKAPAITSGAPPQPLIAEINPLVSVKELMEHMIDPASDNIFDAVWWDNTPKGLSEHKPTTDDDWEKIATGAITVAEGIELLKVPRAFAPAGDVNDSLGPNPPELSPIQIKAKIDKDPVLWIAKIQALRNVTLEVLDIVKKKDVNALWQAGGDLDEACEACHLEYWYPGDRPTVLAEKKFRARFERSGGTANPPSTAPAKK